MKLTRSKFRLVLPLYLSATALLIPLANAGEQEIWYNAKGEIAILKDQKTGQLRKPSTEEIAKINQEITLEKEIEAKLAETAIAPDTTVVDMPVSEAKKPQLHIPELLNPKVDVVGSRLYSDNDRPFYLNYAFINRLSPFSSARNRTVGLRGFSRSRSFNRGFSSRIFFKKRIRRSGFSSRVNSSRFSRTRSRARFRF